MSKKICITFFLKSDKKKIDGSAPIYVRLTLPGLGQSSFSTGKYISPERWKASGKLKKARKEEDQLLNGELQVIRKNLIAKHESLIVEGKSGSAEEVKNIYLHPVEISKPVSHTLLDLFKIHNEKFWSKVAIGKRSEESFKKHVSVQAHLISFMKEKLGIDNIEL